MLAALLVATAPMAAQTRSHQTRSQGKQVFLVARMPETLTLALDKKSDKNEKNGMNGTADSSLAFDNADLPSVVIGVTAQWVLARGRCQIVTGTQVKRPPAPPIIALATPMETFTDAPVSYGLAPHSTVSSAKLSAVSISDANRASGSSLSLSDSLQEMAAPPAPENSFTGTIKIQIQAVP